MPHGAYVEEGQAALEAGLWDDALTAFAASLSERERPEALDGMAEALWWRCEPRASIEYRERACLGFRRMGDVVRAGSAALAVAVTYLFNFGNDAAARGWLARAERLVADADPNPLQGWVWDVRSFLTADRTEAQELLERSLDWARETQDLDLELVALADLGLALVEDGRWEEGLSMLDEAMAGTMGGEFTRMDTVVFTSCNMLSACSLVGDLERASQWCRVADDFMRVHSSPFLFAHCRTHFGAVLVEKGQWVRAEAELTAAVGLSAEAGPGLRTEAISRLAGLRLRQGRIEEAEALLATLDAGPAVALQAAELRLAQGEPDIAVALLERRLAHLGDQHVEAAPTLAMLVDAHIAQQNLPEAAAVASHLESVVRLHARSFDAALASLASAHLATAQGRTAEAVDRLARVLEVFVRLELPFEAARVRLALAAGLAGRDPDLAIAESRSAMVAFEQLGASGHVNAAAAMLRSLGAPVKLGPRTGGRLTKREQEVLGLVGLGLSNPEIAERLFISRKTASHHVSSVLAKLGLRNRAEAVAHAIRNPTVAESGQGAPSEQARPS